MAPRLRSAVVRFDALPEPAWRAIMLALPVDARARAACVCRAWRAFLADVSLWQVLDLSCNCGVGDKRVTANLVRGAVARAAGLLRVLSLDDYSALGADVDDFLTALVVSDGAALQEVFTDAFLSADQLDAVFAAAPRLQVLNASVAGRCKDVLPVLRNDPPYGPLRVRGLAAFTAGDDNADVLALAAAVAAHETIEGLSLSHMDFTRGVNALVDVRRFIWLSLQNCVLDTESLPALARVLHRSSLDTIDITCAEFPVAHEAGMLELSAAVRACRTLTHMKLLLNPPNGASRRTVTELLDAVASLPALSHLNLRDSSVQDSLAFGRALGALIGANLPSLSALVVSGCRLGDEGMAALLDGLAANTHLRGLDCRRNDLSEEFRRDRLKPAMMELLARSDGDGDDASFGSSSDEDGDDDD